MSKREKGLVDMCNSVGIMGGWEWVEVKDSVKGINGNKNTIKNTIKEKFFNFSNARKAIKNR